jgi:hypothetical protein
MKKIFVILLCIVHCALCIDLSAQKLGFIGGPSMSYGVVTQVDKSATFKMIPGGGLHIGMLFEMFDFWVLIILLLGLIIGGFIFNYLVNDGWGRMSNNGNKG